MLTVHQLEPRIAHLPQDQQDTIIEIHNIVTSVSPNADMYFYPDGIAYYEGWRGGTVKGGICQVIWSPRHPFMIAFNLGCLLPDPEHLLVGDRLAKRYYYLPEFNTIPWDAVTELIKASQRIDLTRENTTISARIRS